MIRMYHDAYDTAHYAGMPMLLGCVPLQGMVGYGATVWDLLPTYPQNYGTWCPGGPTYPPRITEHDAGNQRNYSGNQVK